MRSAFLTPSRLLTGIVLLTIFCMLAASFITDRLAEEYLAGSVGTPSIRVHLVHEVIAALDRARESCHSFFATGDERYIRHYQSECAAVDASLARLMAQDKQATEKISHVAELQGVVHQKLTDIGASLAANARGAGTIQSLRTVTAEEDGDLSRVGKLLDSLATEETADQNDELRNARQRTVFHHELMIALGTINALFLAGVAFCAFQIKKLQTLITMCAWSKRVQYRGDWIPLEDYLRQRFGIRFSHGISQEEYDKWSAKGEEDAAAGLPVQETKPRVAA